MRRSVIDFRGVLPAIFHRDIDELFLYQFFDVVVMFILVFYNDR